MEQNGIHLIDLNRTIDCAFTAVSSLKNIVKSGRKVMFVATKKQAKDYVPKIAKKLIKGKGIPVTGPRPIVMNIFTMI